MEPDIILPRKWKIKAHNQTTILIMGAQERTSHVLMKAFLWALYLPQYADLRVEVRIGDRYKPDLVAQNEQGEVLFWGESGQVGRDKIYALLKRYPKTHFAFAKWDMRLAPLTEIVEDALKQTRRSAPVDLISFASDSARFIGEDNLLQLSHADLEWLRL